MWAALSLDPDVLFKTGQCPEYHAINDNVIEDLELINQLRAGLGLKPLKSLNFSLLKDTQNECRKTLAAVRVDASGNCPITHASMNDPVANWEDAVGRYEPIPAKNLSKARELCRTPEWGGGKIATFKASNVQDMDVVIVLHPIQRKLGNGDIVDNYVVFARKFSHTWKNKGKSIDIWVPELFYRAWNLEDAEETAKALTASWEATREQEEEGWGQTELPFSNEFLSTIMAARPGAWTTLSE